MIEYICNLSLLFLLVTVATLILGLPLVMV